MDIRDGLGTLIGYEDTHGSCWGFDDNGTLVSVDPPVSFDDEEDEHGDDDCDRGAGVACAR